MARYEHLPIFADSYRLALLIEQQVAGFPNRLRAGLGSDLRSQVRLMIRLIIRANNTTEKAPILDQLRTATEEFLVLARLAKDIRAFASLTIYEQSSNLAYSVSRQTEGWSRSLGK